MKKYINNNLVDLTAEEKMIREEEKKIYQEFKQNIKNLEQDAENKKASGKQKLLDLGLTEEEVKALIGV
jgi:tripartite-type tricarboxylate transporter receptor subunit TctC